MYGYYEDPAYEDEAIEEERRSADQEQYEMEQAGNAIARAEKRGVCTHGSAAGYHDPPVYPEQAGLKPGQLACTKHTGGCNAVFGSEEEWRRAMDAAIGW